MELRCLFLAAILVIVPASSGTADELPLWESGLGLSGLSMPDYRGSDEQRSYVLPLPYLIYRGEILRSDRKGIYGHVFETDRVQLNISMDASVPVKSDRNAARNRMPDLDATVQIGPALEICLVKNCESDSIVQFRLPIRAVVATDISHADGRGFIANPQLNFDFTKIGSGRGWNLGFAFGPLFATEQYHRYYYDVSPDYAESGVRSAYASRAGYSGSLALFALSKRFDRVWFGAYGRYDNLSNAVFADSPLVKTKYAFMAGLGFAWVFGESATLVQATP